MPSTNYKPYKAKQAPCPRCGGHGYIKYSRDIKHLVFRCSTPCDFTCLAKDLHEYQIEYDAKLNRKTMANKAHPTSLTARL